MADDPIVDHKNSDFLLEILNSGVGEILKGDIQIPLDLIPQLNIGEPWTQVSGLTTVTCMIMEGSEVYWEPVNEQWRAKLVLTTLSVEVDRSFIQAVEKEIS